jgi:cytochrome c
LKPSAVPFRAALALSCLFLLIAFGAGVSPAVAQDTAAGEKVFKRCAACHSLEAGKNKVGPSLAGLFGREAGSVAGFRYSKAMAAANFIWTPQALGTFVTAPKQFVPGTRMPFPGLKDAGQRDALIAYLQTTAANP